MKITQETKEFKPIIIVLETLKEVKEMEAIMGEYPRGCCSISDKIYDYLLEKLDENGT